MQFADGPRWKYQNDPVRSNVEHTGDENEIATVETSGIGYEGVPNRFSRGTSEGSDNNAETVVYRSNGNDDSGTVPHERIQDFLGCKPAKVLQQNSRLGQKEGRRVDGLSDVDPLSNNQSTIREVDEREVIHSGWQSCYASANSTGAHLLLRRNTIVRRQLAR